ncbi:MAG: hypothetical protein LBH82_07345 [Bacteroidales bacterium]|nr:hypothetical protein [Bacteroidales bacterium]
MLNKNSFFGGEAANPPPFFAAKGGSFLCFCFACQLAVADRTGTTA